jgi:sugar phosphate isomerase/epimerase
MKLNQQPSYLTTSNHTLSQTTTSLSRRTFLGTAAGVMGAASLGLVGAGSLAPSAAGAAQAPNRRKEMHLGMLTAPVTGLTLDEVLDMAKRCHVSALEVISGPGNRQIDPMNFTQADADSVNQKLAERGLEISALSDYVDAAAPGKTDEVQTVAKKVIDAAALLGVPTVCMITGLPHSGMSRIAMIKQVIPKIYRPIVDHAKDKGIQVAIENWFATCLQGIDTFDCLLETIPDPNFGLNYDPSHLVHQELDITIPVTRFSKRIFHTHAKDCLIDVPRRNFVGILGDGWWRYVIPGYGDIKWGDYVSQLRGVGYRGVLSIEHEDDTFSPEAGFAHGANYLGQFC